MLALMLIGTTCGLASPYLLGKMIDEIIPSANKGMLLNLILIIVAINIIRFIVGIISEYLKTWLSSRIITDIKEKLFSNLLKMPYPFFERNKPGEVIQVISQEVDKIQSFLTNGLTRMLNNVFTLLSLGLLLCYLNYQLFFITLLVLPVVIIINSSISKKIRKLVKTTGSKEGELYNFYFERIKNISLIKLFNTSHYEQSQLITRTQNLIQLYLRNAKLTALGNNGSFFFVSLSPLIILLVGGYHVMNQMMTMGALVAFIQYSNRLIPPASDVLNLYIDYVKAHESAKRIVPYLNPLESDEVDEISAIKIGNIKKLSCKNLGFSVDETEILFNINVDFIKGSSYVVVGANGAGKSTLIKIIAKLYQPTKGNVVINDEFSLNKITKNEWCKHITVISQDAHIFHESIKNNLMYANQKASIEELWKSLEKVNLKNYVLSLPKDLDTQIGDGYGCANPSGGQKQKLSIARLLLKEADIIILDEITSAMDARSSNEILNLILETFNDKIIISITHNIQDTKLFDQVLLIEDGILVECGKQSDLLLTNSKYRAYFTTEYKKTAV